MPVISEAKPPLFGNIKTYMHRKGVPPTKVILLAPHTNEHGAVLPFQTALARKLMEEGIETEEHKTTDMPERVWELRRKIGGPEFLSERRQIIDGVLNLEDLLIRLRAISEFITSSQNGMVVELHAYDRVEDKEFFYGVERFRRIKGTGNLVMKNMIGDSASLWKEWIPYLQRSQEAASEVAQLRGLNLEDAIKEIRARLQELKKYKNRIKLVDIPSNVVRISEGHAGYPVYYASKPEGDNLSAFEEFYCARICESLGFAPSDLEMVKSVLTIPR